MILLLLCSLFGLADNMCEVVFDQSLPVITVNQQIMFWEALTPWQDPGATMIDPYFGDLTKDLVVAGSVDITKLGVYNIIYSGQDLCGNVAVPVTRQVTVRDTTPPIITLVGGNVQNLKRSWSTYKDPGYSAIDAFDGACAVTKTGSVLPLIFSGTYTLKYTATDKSGNSTTAIRKVIVK